MTSSILPPLSNRADCSPSTQRTASDTLDLPQPLGPTMAVTPCSKVRVTVSANDLKPDSSSRVSFMRASCDGVVGAPGEAPSGQLSVSCPDTMNDGMPILRPVDSACSRVAYGPSTT